MSCFTKRFIRIVILSMVMLVAMFGFSAGAVDQSDSYNKLTSMGFPEDFLNCITEEMMKKIILCIDNSEISDISYNNDGRPTNCSDGNNIIIKSVNAVLKDKSNEEITGECVAICWSWQNGKPIAKQQDLLKIRWYNDDFIYDGKSFYAEDYLVRGGKINVSNTYNHLADIRIASDLNLSEISYYTDLKCFGEQNSGCAVFNLIPSKPLENKEKVSNSIAVEYIHYYKTTVFMIILTVAIIALFTFAAMICRRKRRGKEISGV